MSLLSNAVTRLSVFKWIGLGQLYVKMVCCWLFFLYTNKINVHMLKFTWAYVWVIKPKKNNGQNAGTFIELKKNYIEHIEKQLNKELRFAHKHTHRLSMGLWWWDIFWYICFYFGVLLFLLYFFPYKFSRLEMRVLSSAQNPYSESDLCLFSRVLLQLYVFTMLLTNPQRLDISSIIPCWVVTTSGHNISPCRNKVIINHFHSTLFFRLSSHFSSYENFNFFWREIPKNRPTSIMEMEKKP